MKKLIALLLIMVMVIAANLPLAKPSPRLPRLRR